jgi:hypothetical protein
MRLPDPLPMLLATACTLAATSPAARAAEGLFLTWNDCALAPGAAADLSQACASDIGLQALYCAFRLPAPADSVLGVEIVVDVQHADATVPDWWRFDVAGCRAGSLGAGFDFTSQSACADFLQGHATGALGYYPTEPRGGANQARIRAAASVLPAFGYAQLDASSMYYAARLTITNSNTAVCAGCAGHACLVLNSVIVKRQPGTAGGDMVLGEPGPGNANWATWQGGTGANCASVPARSVTWGQLKGLYR